MAIDFSTIPDKVSENKKIDFSTIPTKRPNFSTLPDRQKPDFSTLPDKFDDEQEVNPSTFSNVDIFTKPLSFLLSRKEKPKVTEGLFGTELGSRSEVLKALRIPENVSKQGLRMMIDKIPDPTTKSYALNAFENIGIGALNIFAEFSSAFLSPESLILGGVSPIAGKVAKTPIFKKVVEEIGAKIPTFLKRQFTYRYGQPEAYREMAETAILEGRKGVEKARDIGQELSQGLSRIEQLRAGELLKGSVPIGDKEVKLQNIVTKARDELTRLGSEAVEEGLLEKETYLKNIEKYMPRLYRKYEEASLISPIKQFIQKTKRIIGKRFLKRKDIPEAVREGMGEILEPAYPVAKGIAELTHDVETAKLFRHVANNPVWSSDVPKEGFVQLTGTAKKLGRLASKYVHPEIARDINQLVKVPNIVDQTYSELLQYWKFGKVVLNPATHSRNLMSNSILLDLSGIDWLKQPALLKRSLEEIKNEGSYFREAKDVGLLGHEFVGGEIKELLAGFDAPKTMLGKIGNITKEAANKTAKIYQSEEQWFKLAKFISERGKGSSIAQASKEAEKWLFNYEKVSPSIDFLRKFPLGSPFITFTAKAAPRIAETILNNPLRIYKYKILFDSIENIAREKLNISDEEVETIKRNSRGQTVILPFRSKGGDLQTLDLSYILPWGDIGERGGMFGLPPALSPGGAFVKPVAEIGFNKSIFTKQPIWLKTDDMGTKTRKTFDHLYKAFLPSFAPPIPGLTKGGYSMHKLISGIEGRPDYFGRVRSLTAVLADVLLGLKTSPATSDIMGKFEQIGLREEFDEIKKEYANKQRNQSLTEDEKAEAYETAKDKMERLIIKRSELE